MLTQCLFIFFMNSRVLIKDSVGRAKAFWNLMRVNLRELIVSYHGESDLLSQVVTVDSNEKSVLYSHWRLVAEILTYRIISDTIETVTNVLMNVR